MTIKEKRSEATEAIKRFAEKANIKNALILADNYEDFGSYGYFRFYASGDFFKYGFAEVMYLCKIEFTKECAAGQKATITNYGKYQLAEEDGEKL